MRILTLSTALLTFTIAFGQEKWSLQKCVEYALEHNITVKQTALQARFSQLTLTQSRASQIPTVGIGFDAQYQRGLTENPTTGVLENSSYFSAGVGLQSGVTLFNWFSIRNTIKADKLTLEADKQQTSKVKDDIALNVANVYLQILLSRQQINVASSKVELTKAQLENTKRQVEVGKLPEINAAQLEAQLAVDSSDLVTTQTNAAQSLLMMKALLTFDAGAPFDVETPPVEVIPIMPLADLEPEAVYTMALANLSQQKVNELRLESARKSVDAAKGRMFPTVSASGRTGSNYVNLKEPVITQGPFKTTGAIVNVGGTNYDVLAPQIITVGTRAGTPFGKQIRNNFGQTVGLSLNIPLFIGLTARTNWERAKLSVLQYELFTM